MRLQQPHALNLHTLTAANALGMRNMGGSLDVDESALSDMMSPRSVMSDEVINPSLGVIIAP